MNRVHTEIENQTTSSSIKEILGDIEKVAFNVGIIIYIISTICDIYVLNRSVITLNCDDDLKEWLYVNMFLNIVYYIIIVFFCNKLVDDRIRRKHLCLRLINYFSIVLKYSWTIYGIICLLSVKDCQYTEYIFTLIMAHIIVTHVSYIFLLIIFVFAIFWHKSVNTLDIIEINLPYNLDKYKFIVTENTNTINKYKNNEIIYSMLINNKDSICSICMDEYEHNDNVRILKCKHHFHEKCIGRWILYKKDCPLCRHKV